MRPQRGQATVEVALVLPVVLVFLVLVLQVGLVMRDRVVVVDAARAAARAVMVEPTEAAAVAAVDRSGLPGPDRVVTLSGDRRPGGLATVTVTVSPTALPLVGGFVSGIRLTQRFTVRVEDSPAPSAPP